MSEIEVRRSARRRRTVSARREGDRIIVMIPASMSRAEEKRWVDDMVTRVRRQEQRAQRRGRRTDDDLMRRARALSEAYLDGAAQPATIRWVGNQQSRWGSCTPIDASIRISDRMRGMPDWVIDSVVMHELTHLLEESHNDRFWALAGRYPQMERARGFLEGYSYGAGATSDPGDPGGDQADVD